MAQRFFEGALHASAYAKFRPTPPQCLGDRIVTFLREKYEGPLDQVVDVGCGNGQCLNLFTSKFSRLLGTDISEAQINVAKQINYPGNVRFKVSPAEIIPMDSGSVQIVNSSQACHWFDLPAFFKEADRILCPKGIIALSGYTFPYFVHPTKADELQQHLDVVYEDRTKGFWGAGRVDVDTEYMNISVPYKETVRESLWTEETQMSLAEFASFLTTWSGIQNVRQKKGDSEVQAILDEFVTNCSKTLETNSKPEDVALVVKRKYFLHMGRKL